LKNDKGQPLKTPLFKYENDEIELFTTQNQSTRRPKNTRMKKTDFCKDDEDECDHEATGEIPEQLKESTAPNKILLI